VFGKTSLASSFACFRLKADWHEAPVSPADDWPSEGHVTFNNYATRYRPGLDLVLNDVSIDIKGGEKVDVYHVFLLFYTVFIFSVFFAFLLA